MKRVSLVLSSFIIYVSTVFTQNLAPQPFPCLHINSQNDGEFAGIIANPNCIEIGGETTETLIEEINPNHHAYFKAGNSITITPNTRLTAQNTGRVRAYIEKDPIEVVWYTPENSIGTVGKYERLELGFKLPVDISTQVNNFLQSSNSGLNPFDPEQIDLTIHLYSPSGLDFNRYAFYYNPFIGVLTGNSADPYTMVNEWQADTTSFPWRFRFAPDEVGTWNIRIDLKINGVTEFEFLSSSFECVPSNKKGYLKVSDTGEEKDRWMYYSETKDPFFVIGMNVASAGPCGYLPGDNLRQLQGLQKLIDVGGNFTRFELGGQAALPDWDNYRNYDSKMDEMYGFDKLLSKCEENDVYFTLFRHHVELWRQEVYDLVRWDNNPYKIGFNITPEQFFTSAEVRKWQKKTLRYIYSRWGYSPNMAFYSYSEADSWTYLLEVDDPTSKDENKDDGGTYSRLECTQIIVPWIVDEQLYIKAELNPNAMFCHSTAKLGPNTYAFHLNSDIVGLHSYGEIKNMNFKERYEKVEEFWQDFGKPVLFEEMGTNYPAMYCCSGIDFHNNIWATSMMGGMGTGMDWWWDRGVMDFGYHQNLQPLKQFFENENLVDGIFKPDKWSDAILFQHRSIENFWLVNDNKDRVLGWLHNATYYWRNLSTQSNCIENLVTDNYLVNPPCLVAEDAFGYPDWYDPFGCYSREFRDMILTEKNTDFDSDDDYKDNFSDNIGAHEVFPFDFKVKNLKWSGMIKKDWYQVDFYRTHYANLSPWFTTIIHTDLIGNLELSSSEFLFGINDENPDVAYKVTYLGNYKNYLSNAESSDSIEITSTVKDETLFVIYPNPNEGRFIIESNREIKKVTIISIVGKVVFEQDEFNRKQIEINNNLVSGKYIVYLELENGIFVSKEIIVL